LLCRWITNPIIVEKTKTAMTIKEYLVNGELLMKFLEKFSCDEEQWWGISIVTEGTERLFSFTNGEDC
jgi:hypothetical protein